MPAKTPAKPARKPVRRKVLRESTIAKSAKAEPRIKSGTAPASELPAIKPTTKAFSLLKQGRHVPSKILHDDLSAPVSTLLARVSSAIEDELTQIEMIVSGGTKLRERAEAERRARTLASLARTLREVIQLRAGEEKTRRDDDAVPRDIGELRRELARRLDKIVGDAKTAHPGEPG